MDESRPRNDDFASHRIRRKPISTESIELRNKSQDPPSSPQIFHSGRYPAYTLIDKQGRQPPKTNWIHRLWLWEVLSIVVATLALAAIIITLLLHKDRPIPKWPSTITINTLIAIFTTILKASLMMPIAEAISQLKWLWFQKSRPLKHMEQFDFASRGPWGSFLLIFTLKGRDLAVVGAMLTLVAMAVDPFAQQIIQYYSCSVMIPSDVASIPFSNNYTDGILGRPTGTPEADAQMQSAVYVGLLDPPSNSSTPLSYNCRTGNCTFPSTEDGATFLSLAFESSCIDISKDIQYSLNVTNTTDVAETILTTSLPSGVSYNNYSGGSHVMQSGNKFSSNLPSDFLIKLSFLMAPYSFWTETENSSRAFECQFFPAVNTYSANITNGVLLEQVLDSQRMEVWPVYYSTFSILLLKRTIRAGRWEECKGIPDPSDENNFPIVTGGNPDFPTMPIIGTDYPFDQLTNRSLGTWNHTRWWPQDCVYYLPYAPTEGLGASIQSVLGNESLDFDSWTLRAEGDLWATNLWNNGSATLDTVQKFMKGLTSSITARWRQGDGISNNMGPANGTVYENATCVHVRWGWIALPAALLLLTIVFLLLTVIQTSLYGSGLVWKSSTLALLFNGLDTNTRQSYGPVLTLKEVKATADTATVQLRETGDGWRLVGTWP